MTQITDQIRNLVARAAGVGSEEVKLEHPDLEQYGDFSTNIALVNKGGRVLAEEIASKLRDNELIGKVEVAGPGFVNISINNQYLIREAERVINSGQTYGKGDLGQGKTVVVDYSAPNIAKAFGIGHLRSTIIGQAIYNLLIWQGYKAIGDNHLGDWGTQFGKLLYMIDQEKPENLNIAVLEELYVRFHQMAEKSPEMEIEARKWFKRLEEGDNTAQEMWKKCGNISMEEFNRIYKLLGIKIDETLGESFYEDKMAGVVEDAKQKALAQLSEGAMVIDIPEFKTPLMLLKSDGATTYATRDLATIKYRMERWQPQMMVYEVGAEQELHFKQVFAAARLLGYVTDDIKLIHTKHGMYLNSDGKKFRTREGKTVKLEAVLLEAIDRAKKLGNTDAAADVGIGAIKYFDLKHAIQSDIVFDWEKMFELQGNSGPYLQYTYARCQSVIRKNKFIEDKEITNYQLNPEERAIAAEIIKFPEVMEEAAERFSPSLLANCLYELAQKYNTFYNKHSILSAEEKDQVQFRLTLTKAVSQVLKNGLGVLGIEAPEVM